VTSHILISVHFGFSIFLHECTVVFCLAVLLVLSSPNRNIEGKRNYELFLDVSV